MSFIFFRSAAEVAFCIFFVNPFRQSSNVSAFGIIGEVGRLDFVMKLSEFCSCHLTAVIVFLFSCF